MQIGCVPDPLNWDRWTEAEAILEPARKLGGFASVLEPDEVLWAVMDGDELLACLTAWLSVDHYCEVKLIGGRDHHRWLGECDRIIGQAAAKAGATRMIGMGRRGWTRSLLALGWERLSEVDGNTVYARELRN